MLSIMIKTKPLYINVLLTFVALGLHGYLSQKFYLLQNAEASGNSFCNLGGMWNCDAVNTSPYARLFGQPIALWGLITHLVFLFTQIMVAMRQDAKEIWADLTIYISSLIAATSVVMGYISMTKLGSLCLFCIAAYSFSFFNIILLKVAGLNYVTSFKNAKNVLTNKNTWITALSIPILVAIFNSSWGGEMNSSQSKGLVNDRINAWMAAPVSKFDLNLGLHMGAPVTEAKMTIVEFADFRCPHCKHAAPSVKAFVQSRKDVALLFKAYPLDGTCNLDPGFNGKGDGIPCRLSFAVFCAEKTEQTGWNVYDSIFEDQSEFSRIRTVEEVDKKLCEYGIKDCDKLKACMDEGSTKVMIQQMAQEATQANVKGTPTFYINNKILSGAQFLPTLEKAYEIIKSQ